MNTATQSEGARYRRTAMLARLKAGPLSTVDCETIIHRGQAVIGELRARGHVIDTIQGYYHYVRGPHEPTSKVTRTIQQQYYDSPHWKRTAARRREFDNHTCVQCKKQAGEVELHVHHWRYELFNESNEDLVTLCADCHTAVHEAISGSKVHFPRRLTPQVIQQIETGRDNGQQTRNTQQSAIVGASCNPSAEQASRLF